MYIILKAMQKTPERKSSIASQTNLLTRMYTV